MVRFAWSRRTVTLCVVSVHSCVQLVHILEISRFVRRIGQKSGRFPLTLLQSARTAKGRVLQSRLHESFVRVKRHTIREQPFKRVFGDNTAKSAGRVCAIATASRLGRRHLRRTRMSKIDRSIVSGDRAYKDGQT
jgi:hypothetical protein